MPNDYYNHSGYPAFGANGDSASARNELASIESGFAKLPTLTGMGLRVIRVNTSGTALEAVTMTTAKILASDGSVTASGNIPMGGYKLTGLAAGTTAGDSVRYEQVGDLATAQAHAAANKATPVAGDEFLIADSAAAYAMKNTTYANIRDAIKAYIDTVTTTMTNKTLTAPVITSPTGITPADVGAEPANANIQAHIADTANPHGVTAAQVGAVNKAGDTMTGTLTLSGNPTAALHASPKQYIDARGKLCNFAATAAPTATDDTNAGYDVGSFWHDTTNDKSYVCNDATATAAVWTEITAAGGGNPTGTIITFAASTPPAGYLECNGSAISRTTYASLFSVIGTIYGAGDGSTTFNVPDLRGEFVRGFDNGRGVDSGRGFGTWQADAFKSHTHNMGLSLLGTAQYYSSQYYTLTSGTGFNTAATGGTETRPRNVALLYCIKY